MLAEGTLMCWFEELWCAGGRNFDVLVRGTLMFWWEELWCVGGRNFDVLCLTSVRTRVSGLEGETSYNLFSEILSHFIDIYSLFRCWLCMSLSGRYFSEGYKGSKCLSMKDLTLLNQLFVLRFLCPPNLLLDPKGLSSAGTRDKRSTGCLFFSKGSLIMDDE